MTDWNVELIARLERLAPTVRAALAHSEERRASELLLRAAGEAGERPSWWWRIWTMPMVLPTAFAKVEQ